MMMRGMMATSSIATIIPVLPLLLGEEVSSFIVL
jgi:hypothetical protein